MFPEQSWIKNDLELGGGARVFDAIKVILSPHEEFNRT